MIRFIRYGKMCHVLEIYLTLRSHASAAAMSNNKVYLHAGSKTPCRDGLYELSMQSFTWTRIDTRGQRPDGQALASLAPVTVTKFVSCGESEYGQDFIRIFDVQSHTWKQLLQTRVAFDEVNTIMTGLHGSAIILSESIQPWDEMYNPVTILRLESKCLQQLAMQIINQKVDTTLWEILPKKLRCKLMGTE